MRGEGDDDACVCGREVREKTWLCVCRRWGRTKAEMREDLQRGRDEGGVVVERQRGGGVGVAERGIAER